MKIYPCLRCGFCCKRAPCAHGELAESGGCTLLEEVARLDGAPIYTCGAYDQITQKPGWELCPAFGAGCSSVLFNDDRDRIAEGLIALFDKEQRAGGIVGQ